MAHVFLSHSSKDKPFVRRLAADIEAAGHTTWLDERDIKAGQDIIGSISAGISTADCLVVVLSSAAVQSGWVDKEWKIKVWEEIQARDTKVVPILLEKCEIPEFLRTKKYANFTGEYERGISEILDALN